MDEAQQQQQLEWQEAQKIAIGEDLLAAAKRQLKFLQAVDRKRCLYDDGPVLDRAIHRYKTCWLPLLAKHGESGMLDGPLAVPLDCEWIWHCHRLNPVQYKKDCEQVYGRILSKRNVVSSAEGNCQQEATEIWRKLYPNEPFELDYTSPLSCCNADNRSMTEDTIKYDLISAVKRQSTFYYQVSRPSMHDDRFLKDAVARYKGFLHLIKRNQERSLKRFHVPTYDIDLIWHSHQLHSPSYCKDLVDILGRVLEHDDTDSDRTKGKKLDVGFSETTKQWEETYGLRYWRSGAMYRGNLPSPLMVTTPNYVTKNTTSPVEYQKHLQLPQMKVVEVLLEVVGIKNLPDNQKGNLFVSVSKRQPDAFFDGSCRLSIFSECGVKKVASFECEPNGELVLTLIRNPNSKLSISRRGNTIGKTFISLQDLVDPDSKLSVEKWFELKTGSRNADSKPIYLHVASSFTVPVLAPHMLYMVRSCPFSVNNCFFPLPSKVQQIRRWTRFLDDNGDKIISIQMRNSKNANTEREIVGVTKLSKETRVLAEFTGNVWSVLDYHLSLPLENTGHDDYLFELRGCGQMRLYLGRRLEFEPRTCRNHRKNESDFMTVVGFSSTEPYGKAVALLNVKSGLVKVREDWFVLPGILLTFILSTMEKEGYDFLTKRAENVDEVIVSDKKADGCNVGDQPLHPAIYTDAAAPKESGGCGSTVKSTKCGGGCSGGCGGGCGDMMKSAGKCGGGCSGGCGGGCGDMMKSAGKCGGGCSGGCGDMVKSSGKCGGGCSGGCGDGASVVGKAGS